MTSDRELLELVAKAAGLNVKAQSVNADDRWLGFIVGEKYTREKKFWNPLVDDGDALRLAVKLEMFLEIHQLVTTADIGIGDEQWVTCAEKHNNDPYAATRRAIVRAAAEIGKEQP